jgi:hypothetical protein
MRRSRQRSGRPHATAERPGNTYDSRATSTLPLPNHRENSKRRQGAVWLESRDALLPWGKPAETAARGRDKR